MNDLNIDDDKIKIDQERAKKDFEYYRTTLAFMGTNVPIQALCLPKSIENVLISNGCLRICDMINLDLAKIKGIGSNRLSLLTSRLDEFFSVSI